MTTTMTTTSAGPATTIEPPATAPAATAPADVARCLLDALTHRDRATTRALLAPDVWLRALLPRTVVEANSADAAAELLDGWLGRAEDCHVVEVDHHTVHGREHIRYRLVLLPQWDREQWHEIEQCGYVRVADGLVTRIDLVCTGYWPRP